MAANQNTDSTVFFDQKFFTAVEGSYFRKSAHTDEAVFILNLGGEEVVLPIPGICREFEFEENTHDYNMLQMVITEVRVQQEQLLNAKTTIQITVEMKKC